jgi:hypothetical protein
MAGDAATRLVNVSGRGRPVAVTKLQPRLVGARHRLVSTLRIAAVVRPGPCS